LARQARAVSGDRRGEDEIVPRGGRSLALGTLCALLFLTFLDNTVVSVTLGDVQTSLPSATACTQPCTCLRGSCSAPGCSPS